MPDDDSKPVKVAMNKAVTVRFKTDAVVASWWVHLVVGGEAIRTWHGRTTDAAADEAIIPAADLKSGRSVLWQLALFGSRHANIDYQIEVEIGQDGVKLATDKKKGKLPRSKMRGLSGSRRIEAKS